MKRVAIANLKGGVGKSTTTVLLAETLALFHRQRVLVIDLDPQSNTSYMLLSRAGVEIAERQQKTLMHFLTTVGSGARVNIANYVQPGASDLWPLVQGHAPGCVDLIPSTPQMWFVESNFDEAAYKKGDPPDERLRDVIKRHLDRLKGSYDVVLFDCPPGFSTLARVGIRLSDLILSPTLADAVSTRSLKDFVDIGLRKIWGLADGRNHYIAVTKFIRNTQTQSVLDELRQSYCLVGSPMPHSVDFIRASQRVRHDSYREFPEKYGAKQSNVRAFGAEFFRTVLSSKVSA